MSIVGYPIESSFISLKAILKESDLVFVISRNSADFIKELLIIRPLDPSLESSGELASKRMRKLVVDLNSSVLFVI